MIPVSGVYSKRRCWPPNARVSSVSRVATLRTASTFTRSPGMSASSDVAWTTISGRLGGRAASTSPSPSTRNGVPPASQMAAGSRSLTWITRWPGSSSDTSALSTGGSSRSRWLSSDRRTQNMFRPVAEAAASISPAVSTRFPPTETPLIVNSGEDAR